MKDLFIIGKEYGIDAGKAAFSLSYLEIYNEKIRDLFNIKEIDLPIREDTNRNILIAGLQSVYFI
jgi:kinesin family protein 22